MCVQAKTSKKKRRKIVTVVTASTMQYLTQHPSYGWAPKKKGFVLRMFVGGQ